MIALYSLGRDRGHAARPSRPAWPAIGWRVPMPGVTLVIRLEAVLCFAVLALALDWLIMPWALDTHPLLHLHGATRTVRVTRHASAALLHACSLALTLLIAAATLAHELGHARALARAGATEIAITIYGAGGACRAQARDTSPLALLWYAAAGPLVTVGLVIALLLVRMAVPWPHTVRVVLWLGAAIQTGTLALNVLPLLARSDGGHMLRALTSLLGGGARTRRLVALALCLPVLSLLATLQGDAGLALLWSAVTVGLTAALAALAWRADGRAPARAAPRPDDVGRTITFW